MSLVDAQRLPIHYYECPRFERDVVQKLNGKFRCEIQLGSIRELDSHLFCCAVAESVLSDNHFYFSFLLLLPYWAEVELEERARYNLLAPAPGVL